MSTLCRYYTIALGREHAPKHEQASSDYFVQLLCTLSTTATTALLLHALDIHTIEPALVFGTIVGIGYQIAMAFNIAINPNFPRPILYGLINAPFFLLGSLMTSVILVWMG